MTEHCFHRLNTERSHDIVTSFSICCHCGYKRAQTGRITFDKKHGSYYRLGHVTFKPIDDLPECEGIMGRYVSPRDMHVEITGQSGEVNDDQP
jgi:hypothetical protein